MTNPEREELVEIIKQEILSKLSINIDVDYLQNCLQVKLCYLDDSVYSVVSSDYISCDTVVNLGK